jgi:hypothetical protein
MGTMAPGSMATRAALWLVAGTAGAVLFWLVQWLDGGPTIPDFMGQQIVAAGDYPASLAPMIGWAVHLGVSLEYAFLFGVIVLLLAVGQFPAPLAIGAGLALALGWVTTIVAPPAISVAISVLGGQGWPAELYPLNTEFGLAFWNHVGFFLLNWLIQGLAPRVVGRSGARTARL